MLPVTGHSGYMSQRSDHRRKKGLVPAAWTWHSTSKLSNTIKRSDRDLTSPSPLLRVHFWSYTPILNDNSYPTSAHSCHCAPCSFTISIQWIDAQRRCAPEHLYRVFEGQDSSTKLLAPTPACPDGISCRVAAWVAAYVKSNQLVPSSLSHYPKDLSSGDSDQAP